MTATGQQKHQAHFIAASLFSAGGMVFGGLVTLATGMILGRWLGPDGFGVYSLTLIAIATAAGLGTFGFDNCIARFTALYLGNQETRQIPGLFRYGITRVILFSLSVAISVFALMQVGVLHRTRLAPLANYSAILLLGIPLCALQLTLLQAILGFQKVKSRILLEKILQPALRLVLPFVLLAIVAEATSAALWGLLASTLLVAAVSAFLLRSNLPRLSEASQLDPNEKRLWLRYALPFVFYSLQNFLWAGMGLDVFLVGALISLRDAGIYAAALRLVPILALARGAMDYSFGPRVGVLFGQSDFQSIGALYRNTSALALSFTLPVAVIMAAFGRPIMRVFFGPGFETGATALAFLAVGFVVDSATGCNTTLLSMAGRSGLVLLNGVLGGLALLLMAFLLIPRWGIAGAGFATASSLVTVNVAATLEIWKLFRLQPLGSKVAKVAIAGLLVAVFGFAWNGWILPALRPGLSALVISAFVTLLLYFGLLLAVTRNLRTFYLGETENLL